MTGTTEMTAESPAAAQPSTLRKNESRKNVFYRFILFWEALPQVSLLSEIMLKPKRVRKSASRFNWLAQLCTCPGRPSQLLSPLVSHFMEKSH